MKIFVVAKGPASLDYIKNKLEPNYEISFFENVEQMLSNLLWPTCDLVILARELIGDISLLKNHLEFYLESNRFISLLVTDEIAS